MPTFSQLADVFTKILPSNHFNELLHKLGMTHCQPSLKGAVESNETDNVESIQSIQPSNIT